MPANGTRAEMVVASIQRRIAQGHVAQGDRLPSIRAAARAFGVSKNTVIEAYERLCARGLIAARPGSGHFVLRRPAALEARDGARLAEATDAVSLLTEQLERQFPCRVGEGRPPAAWMDRVIKPAHWRRVAGDDATQYDAPAGYLPLRRTLARTLAERGMDVGPDDILLTLGGNHALDMIIRQFVRPGDRVMVDSPGYYPLFAKLTLAGAQICAVPRHAAGPDLSVFEEAVQAGARMFFTQSLGHNPTATSAERPVAEAIAASARRARVTIIDSDIFGDLMPADAPRMGMLAGGLVVGSFSKTLSANLRVGYIAGTGAPLADLRALKMLTVVNSCGHSERIVQGVLDAGDYRRQLARLNRHIRDKLNLLDVLLARRGLRRWGPHGGGYYAWLALPPGADEEILARDAAMAGVFLAPGHVFLANRAYKSGGFLRLNLGYVENRMFWDWLDCRFNFRCS